MGASAHDLKPRPRCRATTDSRPPAEIGFVSPHVLCRWNRHNYLSIRHLPLETSLSKLGSFGAEAQVPVTRCRATDATR